MTKSDQNNRANELADYYKNQWQQLEEQQTHLLADLKNRPTNEFVNKLTEEVEIFEVFINICLLLNFFKFHRIVH